MPASLILTIVGPDRPGLVNLISDRVTAHGGNWLESRMANLAGQFAGIVHLHVPQASIEALIVAFQELASRGVSIEELVTDCVSGSMSGESLVRASAQLRVPAHVGTAQLRGALEAIANDLMVDLTLDDSGPS